MARRRAALAEAAQDDIARLDEGRFFLDDGEYVADGFLQAPDLQVLALAGIRERDGVEPFGPWLPEGAGEAQARAGEDPFASWEARGEGVGNWEGEVYVL